MNIDRITKTIESFAPLDLQEAYDNAGLICGNSEWECTGVLCSLDVTLDVVQEAVAKNCNLIVAHHPILFTGLKNLTGNNHVDQVIIAAIKADIALYAAHTNLDNVLMGVNGKIAQKLNLENTSILLPRSGVLRRLTTFAPIDKAELVRQALFSAGAGHVGNYSDCSFNSDGTGTFKAAPGAHPYVGEIGQQHHEKETKIEIIFPAYLEQSIMKALLENHPYEEVAYDIIKMENKHYGIGSGVIGNLPKALPEKDFLQLVKEVFKIKVIKHTALVNKPIQKVAVCGGAGSFLIPTAARRGADIFITSDIKYHEFFGAEGKMVIADIGHYESEQYTVELLHDLLVEKFPTFAVLKTEHNTNPVQYFV